MRHIAVLLVEDNDFTRSTVAAALENEGCRVVAAVRTAREAMHQARGLAMDCVLVDLHLGTGPTGIDVAHALRRDHPDLGVVFLTSYSDPRLLATEQLDLPAGSVYLVKNDVHSTGQLRQAIDVACGLVARPKSMRAGTVPLTDMQVEMLRLVAAGLTNAEIARRRVVTERAVETALTRILRRLEIEPADGENHRVLLTQAYYSMIGGAGAVQ